MNTGHDGSLSTGHANSPEDMLSRLEVMSLMASDMPLMAIRKQIASSIDIIVQLGRLRDHSRRVLEITEIMGFDENRYVMNPLFRFMETGGNMVMEEQVQYGSQEAQRVNGSLVRTGNRLKNRDKLHSSGLELETI